MIASGKRYSMDLYPRDFDKGSGCYWGPEVVVWVNRHYGKTAYIAHLEADIWLVRDSRYGSSWDEILEIIAGGERIALQPIEWAPLPADEGAIDLGKNTV